MAREDFRDDRRAVLPPRLVVHQHALELAELARRAAEFSRAGPTANLPLALRQFERMRAILGPGAVQLEGRTSGEGEGRG